MAESDTPAFLDVPNLLGSSLPQRRGQWFWYVAVICLLLTLLGEYLSQRLSSAAWTVDTLSSLALLGLIGATVAVTWTNSRAMSRESQCIESIEELAMLRRWGEAAVMLDGFLSQPTQTQQARVKALVFLAVVLNRFDRFHDALTVYDYLLEADILDESTTQHLRIGRAMALLREDRLFDVDRAINELRRQSSQTPTAGMELVELYRDVKTGHPEEAIKYFQTHRPQMAAHLGHRLGDVFALVARAYDLLNQPDEAARYYQNATRLMQAVELQRRYPEVKELAGKYAAAVAPAEAA